MIQETEVVLCDGGCACFCASSFVCRFPSGFFCSQPGQSASRMPPMCVPPTLPVWTTNPDSLCQQSQPEQPTGNPFDQSSQPQQPQQQQPQQQNEKKDSDGVAGWIRDMFGGN